MASPPSSGLPSELAEVQRALAGQYSIEREIGRGGMGVVYLAREVLLDRPVAIKVLPPSLAANPDAAERFLREARTAAKLFHPHIVPIHRVDTVGDVVFIVMGFIDGESAAQRLSRNGPFSISVAVRILRETAWALGYAHARGVIHRDIKPDNLLIERESGRTFVTDFGIAHVEGASSLTQDGQLFGSVGYMSPEQIRGEPLDGRSDLYALGVLAHALLTGKPPFAHAAPSAVLAMHLNTAAPPIAAILPVIPSRLAVAVDRCLSKNPADRFESVDAFAAELENLEPKREIPAPIRAWVSGSGLVDGGVWAVLLLALVTAVLFEGGWGWLAFFAPAAYAGLQRQRATRRLFAMGFGIEDLRSALASSVSAEEEAVASQVTRDPIVARILRRAAKVSLGLLVASIALAFGLGIYGYERLVQHPESVIKPLLRIPDMMIVYSGLGWIVTRISAELIAPKAVIGFKERELRARMRFWRSKWGERLAGLLRTGLRKSSAVRSDQPTELIVGGAATALFEGLPTVIRERMPELPATVKALEQAAAKLRNRIVALDRLAAEPIPAARAMPDNLVDQRREVTAGLAASRKRAEEQLGLAVAALETIRLDLLRAHVDHGAIDGLTANVEAAARLATDVDRAIEGRQSVEQLLAPTGSMTSRTG